MLAVAPNLTFANDSAEKLRGVSPILMQFPIANISRCVCIKRSYRAPRLASLIADMLWKADINQHDKADCLGQ